ncbi:ExeM/NucH family extracellular endonuclease [uncultured Deinococcus sp.]|uniref:ExeM/NucH family extracellular endonuclease n=2 Tax=uncultured Deinococcus sp. TaxID=158789 RepID=UPI00258FB266|nr:ExeM/NucH family extracellular endonuclease [uncultured Deinococcus sp.]
MSSTRFALRSASSLLLGLLALSACGQPASQTPTAQTPVAQTPAPARPLRSLGLYELKVSGLGTQNLQANMERAGGLSAQASEVGGLSFTPYSTVNLVDSSKKVIHMTASFTVTNNSGAAVVLPTYVPVDTDGSLATQGETPFLKVRTRTGAAASSTGLKPERSYQQSGTAIQEDPNATPLVGDLDTGALDLNLPAGTTAPGISHQGWQATRLEAGASQVVNFAVSVPIQGNDISDSDPFSFSMLVAAADSPAALKLTNVASVQGQTPSGDAASPLAGQTVTVEGVVTADLRAGTLQGFYVQEEGIDADGDSTTSDGVFVYCGTNCANVSSSTIGVGDRVRVTGTVGEFVTATQITAGAGGAALVKAGVGMPAATTLKLPLAFTERERYEGMRVTASGVVTNNFTLGRGGSFDIADSRLQTFTQVNAPSTAGNAAYTADLKNRFIRIDDGTRAQNPDPEVFARGGQPLSADNTLRGGDTVTATGVLGYSNDGWTGSGSLDTYRIHASAQNVQVQATNPRSDTPDAVGGSLRVGSMNVLNFFTSLVTSNSGCTPNGTDSANSRGANNCDEFLRQRTKTVKAILGLNPDVLGLLEMQNDFDKGANSSVANLVGALNAEAGAGTYAYINPGAKVGTDAISVAMIYKPASVSPVGQLAKLDNSYDPSYIDNCSRPTLAQTFQSNANGGRFTAVMLHLKSKGSACGALGDTDRGDGQGNAWKAREQAAGVIGRWLATNPTGIQEDDRILMGDYNAYEMETPLSILADAGYGNLFSSSAYSYQFDGQWGSLDHALASASLKAQVTGQTKWHINSDEPTVLDYNTEFKTANQISGLYAPTPFRGSDHDPVLVGLNLTAQAPIQPTTPTAATSLSASPASLSVTSGGASAGSTVTASTQNYSGGNLTVSTSNAAGLTVSAPATTAPNGSFTVSVTAPAGTAAGTYPVTVTTAGDGGTPSASTTINVTVSSATTTPPTTGGSDLYFSEYVEGSSNNKAIEIYNPTSQAVDLSAYKVTQYNNGSANVTYTLTLSGTLQPGATYVIANANSATAILDKAQLKTTSQVMTYNGDDALALVKGTTNIDVLGQIGVDPGTEWGSGLTSTADNTLRRKAGVTAGDPDGSNAFDPSVEWDGYATDTFDGLGSR